ncbi:hypothetical protein L4C33_10990 [Vibrio makurazakiensis]|uniref:hypothetical protein n=1 Tax=Vibrio makurazakiensis TaxID=2910250 RepID=UPI003D0AAEF4
MIKTTATASILIAAFSMPASASCEFFSEESIMLTESNCLSLSNSLDSIGREIITMGGLLEDESANAEPVDYWSEWALQSKDAPLLTQSVANNHFGLGMWIPEELDSQKNDMSTEEWLMNHGLQLSLGFGNKEDGEPRMRFDYRWHEDEKADVMMQIEVPF